jgi:hypothetical protein
MAPNMAVAVQWPLQFKMRLASSKLGIPRHFSDMHFAMQTQNLPFNHAQVKPVLAFTSTQADHDHVGLTYVASPADFTSRHTISVSL